MTMELGFPLTLYFSTLYLDITLYLDNKNQILHV
jgi:hypothetical protein